MKRTGRTRALAASLRLPNLPSVWSNTLTGVVFACLIQDGGQRSGLALALISATCLYFAGNLLNDWADLEWDRKNRPERALPSGVFNASLYRLLSAILVTLALASATLAGTSAFLVAACLIGFILTYTWSHKRTAWGVIPMALCRASLPLLGYFSCIGSNQVSIWIGLPAALLFVYLILLSLRARCESRPEEAPEQGMLTAIGFLLPPVILATCWYFPHHWTDTLLICFAASIPYLIWTGLSISVYRKPIPRQVSALLAGIPWVDSLFLLPYLLMGYIGTSDSLSGILSMAWLPAFIAGRLLQRYVPAT